MNATWIEEPAQRTPVAGEFDVVVCGAGPAGVGAALFAARAGARTLLLETHGCLGGIWTAGLLSWIIDPQVKAGVMRELVRRLDACGGRRLRRPDIGNFAYDPEIMKRLLETLCREAGVAVRLHTRIVRGLREGGQLVAVVTESKSGREAWRARCFVDATGDGDVAAFSNCRCDLGRPEDGRTQPMSLMALLGGIRFQAVEPWVAGGMSEPKARLLAEFRRAGIEPSYGLPTMLWIHDDLFALMANHQYGVSALDAAGITAATVAARDELHRLAEALRGLGGPWADLRIVATAEQIGVREGRRPQGLYRVNASDLRHGARHPDAVCRVFFHADVHATESSRTRGVEPTDFETRPYDIPLRALIASDVDGLVFAGRCISGDFLAHSSYRVTGYSVALGEAAGVAAAVSARERTTPRHLEARTVLEPLESLRRG